ncbi:MAG: YihY/virulence factor BrkB family protein [Bacteroidales bacterium]|nr:YihY/virulence factor BrkB family protein [Bacteroidales bacterium]
MKVDVEKYKNKAVALKDRGENWLRGITLPGFHGKPLYDVLVYFLEGFSKGYLTDRAAAVAFNVFLAIFPAVMVLFTFIPYMPLEGTHTMIVGLIHQVVPENIAGKVVETIDEIMSRQHNTLMSVGIIMAFYFSSGAIRAFFRGFDMGVNHIGKMSFLRMYAGALITTLFLGVLLILSVALIIIGNDVLPWFFNQINFYNKFIINLIDIGRWMLTVFVLLVAIAVLYYFGNPDKDRKFRLFTPGTIMFTLLFIVGTVGFNFYIVNFSNYNALYGSIGGLIIFMMWIYVNCIIVLIGYELDASIFLAEHNDSSLISTGSRS